MLQEFVPWLALAIASASLAFAIHSARSKRITDCEKALEGKADNVSVQALSAKVGLVEDNCIRLGEGLRHMPDRESMHRLEVAMLQVKGELGILAESVKPIKAISVRLQEAILERATQEHERMRG